MSEATEDVHQVREFFEWLLRTVSDRNFGTALLLLALGLALYLILCLVQRDRQLQAARLRAYAESYEWMRGQQLLLHNVVWRLLAEVGKAKRSNDKITPPAAKSRLGRIAQIEADAWKILYAKPVLPVVKDKHMDPDEVEDDDRREALPADG